MWHEARQQQKLVRNQMVDGAKRAERRRKYYESVRSDPEQFMQIHGRKSHIYIDAGIARAAEDSNILRKWQNDPKLLIDRFDARSHLDIIPTAPAAKPKLSQTEELEEIQCDFERYRILILNEFQKYEETEFLKQIAAKEFWHVRPTSIYKTELEKKKKASKSAIGFSYKDSEVVAGSSKKSDSEESEEEDIEDQQEYDLNFDVNTLCGDRGTEITRVAENYGRLEDGFIELLKIDQKERSETEQIREIDKTKHTLSGKYAKSDRAKLKRQRAAIVSKFNQNEATTNSLLSMLRKSREGKRRRSSSSESDNDINEKVKFVTSYDDEPAPATSNLKLDTFPLKFDSPRQSEEGQRLLNLKKQRSESPDFLGQDSSSKQLSKSPSNESPKASPSKKRASSADSSSSSSSASSPSSVDSRDYRPLDIHSSMSESEQERIEILNRKRRIEFTKRSHKLKERRSSSSKSDDGGAKEAEAAKRLRRRLDKKLKNAGNQMKAEEHEKKKETELKQRERDEILMTESRAIRQRERDKRLELEGLEPIQRETRRSDRRSPSPKRQRRSPERRKHSRRSNSRDRPSHSSRRRSRSPRRHRSRSRDRKSRRRSRS